MKRLMTIIAVLCVLPAWAQTVSKKIDVSTLVQLDCTGLTCGLNNGVLSLGVPTSAITFKPYTTAGLPSAVTAGAGATAQLNDFQKSKLISDGTNWIIIGTSGMLDPFTVYAPTMVSSSAPVNQGAGLYSVFAAHARSSIAASVGQNIGLWQAFFSSWTGGTNVSSPSYNKTNYWLANLVMKNRTPGQHIAMNIWNYARSHGDKFGGGFGVECGSYLSAGGDEGCKGIATYVQTPQYQAGFTVTSVSGTDVGWGSGSSGGDYMGEGRITLNVTAGKYWTGTATAISTANPAVVTTSGFTASALCPGGTAPCDPTNRYVEFTTESHINGFGNETLRYVDKVTHIAADGSLTIDHPWAGSAQGTGLGTINVFPGAVTSKLLTPIDNEDGSLVGSGTIRMDQDVSSVFAVGDSGQQVWWHAVNMTGQSIVMNQTIGNGSNTAALALHNQGIPVWGLEYTGSWLYMMRVAAPGSVGAGLYLDTDIWAGGCLLCLQGVSANDIIVARVRDAGGAYQYINYVRSNPGGSGGVGNYWSIPGSLYVGGLSFGSASGPVSPSVLSFGNLQFKLRDFLSDTFLPFVGCPGCTTANSSSPWANAAGSGGGNWQNSVGVLESANVSQITFLRNTMVLGNDQYAQIKVYGLGNLNGGNPGAAPSVRIATDGSNTGYQAQPSGTGGTSTMNINRVVNGVATQLSTCSPNTNWNDSDTIKLQCTGSTTVSCYVYQNGAEITACRATDNTGSRLLSGSVGISAMYGGRAQYFTGGTVNQGYLDVINSATSAKLMTCDPTTDTCTAAFSGGSSGKATCWKDATHIGYCSTQPDAGGACTCN